MLKQLLTREPASTPELRTGDPRRRLVILLGRILGNLAKDPVLELGVDQAQIIVTDARFADGELRFTAELAGHPYRITIEALD